MELCGRCRGEGECITERDGWTICPECGGDGYVDAYEEDEWREDDEPSWAEYVDSQFDYSCLMIEWRYPEFRPSFVAVFRWWGVQYLPVWCYGVARGFWFDSVVSHFRRDDNIRDIPF